MCSRFFPTFSSISFSLSGFMCRSLIHCDLSFVQGDKNRLICIFLHADLQMIQYHLLKMLPFFPLDVFSSFVKYQVTVSVWVLIWVFNSIPLNFLPVFVPIRYSFFYHYCSVAELEVRDGDSTSRSFVLENSFCNPGFFCYFK